MLNTILFAIIPFSLMIAIAVGMPFYRLNLMKKAGKIIIPLSKKTPFIAYFSAGIAFLLMLLSVKVDFRRFNFIIPSCAVIGLYLSIRENSLYPVNGVYENLMIVGSDILFFKDMVAIMTEEESHHPDYVLMIKTSNKGPRQFIFNNANEANEVKQELEKKLNV